MAKLIFCRMSLKIVLFKITTTPPWEQWVNRVSIGSDNGLSPGRSQAIIWTNAGILAIESLGTNFSEILIEVHIFSFKKMHLKMSSAEWQTFCPGRCVKINIAYSNSPLVIYFQSWGAADERKHWRFRGACLDPDSLYAARLDVSVCGTYQRNLIAGQGT